LFIEELLSDLYVGKQCIPIKIFKRAWLLVLARLLQVNTIAGTVERHLALLTATLRADTPVDCRAEAFLLAGFGNGKTKLAAPMVIMSN
jgi:hypothetical protein